jgi:hypothetical protein
MQQFDIWVMGGGWIYKKRKKKLFFSFGLTCRLFSSIKNGDGPAEWEEFVLFFNLLMQTTHTQRTRIDFLKFPFLFLN